MKKILITGCSGLVGIHLVKETIMRNHLVIGVDIRKSDELPESDRFKFYELDLTKEENVRKLFEEEKPDAVFNCFARLIVETILYRKYKGPVNKFSWCPVVMVNVFSSFKSVILCWVDSEVAIF